jgi:hypothetical protein
MDPTTITNATFTLAVAGGGAPVNGTVAYDPASQIATFTPSANLAGNTQYTAMISNLVKDLTGNALAAGAAPIRGALHNEWSGRNGSRDDQPLINVSPVLVTVAAAITAKLRAAPTILL